MDEYKRLVALERRLGDTGNDLPIVVLGNRILGGNKEIEAELSGLLTKYAVTGLPDIAIPTLAEADAMLRAGVQGAVAAHIAYFEEAGCRECARVERMSKLAAERHPGLEVHRFAMASRDDRVLLEALCERAGVDEAHRLLVRPSSRGGGPSCRRPSRTRPWRDCSARPARASRRPGR